MCILAGCEGAEGKKGKQIKFGDDDDTRERWQQIPCLDLSREKANIDMECQSMGFEALKM